jgi:hypothetical protein
MTLPWSHIFTCLIAGSTGSGKTYFVKRFLENLNVMIDTKITEIIWLHGAVQPLHQEIRETCKTPIRFFEGILDMDEIAPETNPPPRMVIVDDLMRTANVDIADIFSKGSHHRNISVMFLTQNLFHRGKYSRDLSLNSQYIVVFKNPREKSQIASFARQVCPENPRFIQEAYVEATSKPHSYLLFDLKQSTPEEFRYRSLIFPNEQPVVYISKKK